MIRLVTSAATHVGSVESLKTLKSLKRSGGGGTTKEADKAKATRERAKINGAFWSGLLRFTAEWCGLVGTVGQRSLQERDRVSRESEYGPEMVWRL